MARPLRLEFPGAIYHITSRGNARDTIFLDDADRALFLAILGDAVHRHNWLCHAYCLMDNHYHLLIETIDPTLSLGMRRLNGVYTQSFNRSHKRAGHVFQGRFKSILVEKGAHLLELCRYIVLNPVKADMAEHPEEWEWSSYMGTAGLSQAHEFLSTEWVLAQFSQRKKEAEKRYIEFVRQGMQTKAESPWDELKGQIFFGGSRFIAEMQERLGEKKEIGEIPREQRFPNRPSLEELFMNIEKKGQRNLKIGEAHLRYGYSYSKIAAAAGIHYTTVSRVIGKLRKIL